MKKGFTFAFVALIVAGLVVHAREQQTGDGQGAAAAKVDQVKVDAGGLFAAYHDNEVAADAAYKGKPVEVSGLVASITTDIASRPVVSLVTSNEFMPVSARGIAASDAGKLRKGAAIKLSCTGAGMVMGSPQLAGCTVFDGG